MEIQEDNFNLFAPINFIKGKDSKGNTLMKMSGIASTSSKDADDEFLDPKGFELDYFLNFGYMNWNHQSNKNPLAIIGKPTSAKISKGQMILECELFNHNPLAKDVYKLAEVLKTQGLNLGFSIEGKVIERDKKDPKKVLKAKITGCAITPNPKNQDSIANIVKGYDEGDLDLIKGMYSAYEESTEEERKKALTAGSESGTAISKESLDGDIKDLLKKKKMKKGEVLNQLMQKFPNNTGNQINQIFNIIETIEKKEKMEKSTEAIDISQESIEKAYATLGLTLEKGESSPEKKEEGELAANKDASEDPEKIEKGEKSEKPEKPKKKDDDKEKESSYFMLKGKKYDMGDDGSYSSEGKKYNFKKGEMVEEESEEAPEKKEGEKPAKKTIEKGEVDNGIELPNADSELIKGFADLMKGQFEAYENKMGEKFTALGLLNKGLEDQLNDAIDRLDEFENKPQPAKSIRTQRFIEKSYDNDLNKGGEHKEGDNQRMSASLHKAQVLNILDDAAGISKGEINNPTLANDICLYETTGDVSKLIQETLSAKNITLIK